MTSEETETSRLEAFSDGVFAIAITLLVLGITVPGRDGVLSSGGLFPALLALWPSYLGYVISFVTIGIMWANHHTIFHYVRRTDRYLLIINVFFLMCIGFLPFPTAVLADYLKDADHRQAAVAAYSGAMFLNALAFNALWWYGTGKKRLLSTSVDLRGVRSITRRYALGPILYATAFGLAFMNIWASLSMHGVLAAFFLLPEKKGEGV